MTPHSLHRSRLCQRSPANTNRLDRLPRALPGGSSLASTETFTHFNARSRREGEPPLVIARSSRLREVRAVDDPICIHVHPKVVGVHVAACRNCRLDGGVVGVVHCAVAGHVTAQ